MSKKAETAVELFKRKAEPVSIRVTEVKDLKEAMAYALDICEKKDACQLLLRPAHNLWDTVSESSRRMMTCAAQPDEMCCGR